MKNAVRRVLHKFGIDVTPYPLPDWVLLRQQLLILFAALQINCVIDVGAHFGEYASFLRDIGYEDTILSFEPVQDIRDPRVFLKMDTQGWDLNVLSGASGALDRIRALQSEISVRHIYDGMPDYLESMNVMRKLGFELMAVVPVSYEGLKVIEFD